MSLAACHTIDYADDGDYNVSLMRTVTDLRSSEKSLLLCYPSKEPL